RNEIKDENLLSPSCPVRYIITVNALKEGWDCPFAYILASLADRSSSVDVEQILGRVLRMPWVRKNQNPMLNMSYVLTSSSKFLDTLDNIVKGLNKAGFSENDYKVAEPTTLEEPKKSTLPIDEMEDLFGTLNDNTDTPEEDDKRDEIDPTQIEFDPQKETDEDSEQSETSDAPSTDEKPKSDVEQIEQQAKAAAEKEYVAPLKNTDVNIPNELGMQVKKYKMKEIFSESAQSLKLPQFMSADKSQDLTNNLFVEVYDKKLFEAEMLLKDFKLGNEDSNINFDAAEATLYRVDLDETTQSHTPTYLKIDNVAHEKITAYILDPKQKKNRIKNCTFRLKNIIGKMYPIPDKEIEIYINHVLERFSDEQFSDLVNHEYTYAEKIKEKIKSLSIEYKEKQFFNMVDKDLIYTENIFALPTEIIPNKTIAGIPKSLYEKEGDIDGFEREVINDVANMTNIEWWTRNLERGKGFYINGFINHYPDFIIKTKKGKIVILETKGDHLDAEKKIQLGKLWANKAGNNYRYCLVYKNRKVEDAYTKQEFLDVLSEL
nr:restriction endonuclease [Bacteroidales bacterium]